MKAIILLGGFGTRLRSVVPDLPKPMAPIQGKPFLAYLLDYLASQQVTEVIFSVHYLREKIQAYFGAQYGATKIHYVEEAEPLGTGGAIVYALQTLAPDETVFVLNGDTFVKLDYQAMYAEHQKHAARLTLALCAVDDCQRYGKVVVEQDRIVAFKEKGESGPGFINAGVYLLSAELFSQYGLGKQFSFEQGFLFPYLAIIKPQAFVAEGYFIDIGVPEDYARAQVELVT